MFCSARMGSPQAMAPSLGRVMVPGIGPVFTAYMSVSSITSAGVFKMAASFLIFSGFGFLRPDS